MGKMKIEKFFDSTEQRSNRLLLDAFFSFDRNGNTSRTVV